MIQIPSWLLVDVSSKFLKLSCNAVAWYYIQSLLKMPRTFFFLKIEVTVQPAITLIYSEDWLLQKKAANSIHIMNTGKKTWQHWDYSHLLCYNCVTSLNTKTIVAIKDYNLRNYVCKMYAYKKCKKLLKHKKNPYVYQTTLLLACIHLIGIKMKLFASLKFSHL